MEKALGTTTSFSVLQRSSSGHCRAQGWKRQLLRGFSGRPLAACRLLLLLTAVINCTVWLCSVTVPAAVASLTVNPSSLQSPEVQPDSPAATRWNASVLGPSKTLTAEEEAVDARGSGKEGFPKITGSLKLDTTAEETARRSLPSSADESAGEATDENRTSEEAQSHHKKGPEESKNLRKPSVFFRHPESALQRRPTLADEVEGPREEEESRVGEERGAKEGKEVGEVFKQTRDEESHRKGQKEEHTEEDTAELDENIEPNYAVDEQGEPQALDRPMIPIPLNNPRESSDNVHTQSCTSEGASWCERQVSGREAPFFSIIPNTLRITENYISSMFARPFFSFPFSLSFPFHLVGPANVCRSGPCQFTFTLDDTVPMGEARLYLNTSQRLVGIAADRQTKHTSEINSYYQTYGERTQLLAAAAVPDKCMISDALLESGLIAWSCAGKTSTASRRILVTFPSEAHAKDLVTKEVLSQEAYDMFQQGDLSNLTPREICLLSGRTMSECELLEGETAQAVNTEEQCNFSSTGYASDEVRLPKFKYGVMGQTASRK